MILYKKLKARFVLINLYVFLANKWEFLIPINLLSSITISLEFRAKLLAFLKLIPTSASFNANASFMPSPTIKTLLFFAKVFNRFYVNIYNNTR